MVVLWETEGSAEESAQEMMEEEEEIPKPKSVVAPPGAPKKEHVNVVFIGHAGELLVAMIRNDQSYWIHQTENILFSYLKYLVKLELI